MEILDIYDNNGNTTGKTLIRGDKSTKLEPNEHIALVTILIENNDGDFLIQKTSKEKGGQYGTTGGHVDHGETPLEAIKRETKEELGINIDNDEIKEFGYLMFDMPLRFMYYLKKDIKINEIQVQKEEVDYVRYMTVSEIQDLINTNQMLKSHGIIFNEVLNNIKTKQSNK